MAELIEHQTFKTEFVCTNHKDTHMNIFVVPHELRRQPPPNADGYALPAEDVLLYTTYNKNISVFNLHAKELLYNLSIDQKEMSCSRQHGDKLFIGTFCDTLFMFQYQVDEKEGKGKLQMCCEMRTHESIISLCIMSPEYIICGQSNGYIDVIELKQKKKNTWAMDHISSKFYMNIGYINCII